MTISYGLCWNIDSRKIIWPLRAHFGSENESLKGLRICFVGLLVRTSVYKDSLNFDKDYLFIF